MWGSGGGDLMGLEPCLLVKCCFRGRVCVLSTSRCLRVKRCIVKHSECHFWSPEFDKRGYLTMLVLF